jgi:hypothetical protein
MNRPRLGSLLGLLCSSLFLCSLFVAIDPYYAHPRDRYFLWGVCGALFAGSVGLWFQRRWGRLALLIGGGIFLFLCLDVFVGVAAMGTPLSSYRFYILHSPTLAVSYYFAKLACSVESLQCYEASTCVQPALTILTMTVILKPLASNNRWSDRDS